MIGLLIFIGCIGILAHIGNQAADESFKYEITEWDRIEAEIAVRNYEPEVERLGPGDDDIVLGCMLFF